MTEGTPTVAAAPAADLRACRVCGLVQRVVAARRGRRLVCSRCRASIPGPGHPRAMSRAAAMALAALILYPFAMLLPVIEVDRLGHRRGATIWSGAVDLMAEGSVLVGLIVLACSVVAPVVKLTGVLVLSLGGAALSGPHRQAVYRLLELIGRWGMVDVLLVAVLVAAVKLGDWMSVRPGPGALAFAGVVVLSLLASACFDPAAFWRTRA